MFAVLRKRLTGSGSGNDIDDDFDDDYDLRQRVAQKIHSRRPPNTAFRQQRLKSWQPVLTPRVVLPLLLLVGIICIPIGLGVFVATYKVETISIDYSDCSSQTSSLNNIPDKYYSYHFKSKVETEPKWKFNEETGVCTLEFEIPNDIKGNTYMYYKLTNFYQNHRKYVESYDWEQLKGKAVAWDDLSSHCEPLRYRDDKIIYPAGLVANSLFNDTISTQLVNTQDTSSNYYFQDKGIAWKSDLSLYKTTQYNVSQIVPPINWSKRYPNGYTEDDLKELAQNEHFMNWMKTAALPAFMKLYGKTDTSKNTVLKEGTYSVDIEMNYPVSIFGGTKSFVITTSSVIGGRHMSLSICYLIGGGLSILFMALFLFKQLITRNQRDHAFLDNLDVSTTAATSGLGSLPAANGMREVL